MSEPTHQIMEVTTCRSCPFRQRTTMNDQWRDDCQAAGRPVTMSWDEDAATDKRPPWCPLNNAPVLVQLKEKTP